MAGVDRPARRRYGLLTHLLVGVAVSACVTSAAAATHGARFDRKAPTTPSQLRVTSFGSTAVLLSWRKSTDNSGSVKYAVASDGVVVGSSDRTWFLVTGLSCGRRYSFSVRAFDPARNYSPAATISAATGACADSTPPTPPTGVVQLERTANSITTAWTPATDDVGVVAYDLFKGGELVGQTAGTSYIFAGLSCAWTYALSVVARDAAGNASMWATVLMTTSDCPDVSPPSTPTGLRQVHASASSVGLAWSPSTDDVGVVAYDVYRGGVRVTSTAQTSATVGALTCGQSYTVSVAARDAAGNHSAAASATVASAPCADATPPSVPQDQRITGTSKTTIGMAWSASTDDVGVTGYNLYLDGALVTTVAGTSHTYSGLQCGTRYVVALEARDAAGNVSNRAEATTSASTSACSGDTAPPSPPGNVTVSEMTATSIKLAWSPASDDSGVASYGVYRDGSKLADVDGAARSYVVSGLSCGTSMTFAVDAADAAANRSSRVEVVAATAPCPDDEPPSAPTELVAGSATETAISLQWKPSTDNLAVAGYGIYRAAVRIATTQSTSFTITGLSCGTTATVGVDAFDARGNRSPQTTIIVSTTACQGSESSFGRTQSNNMYPQTGDRKRVSRFVAPENGDLVALSALVDGQAGGSGSQQLRLVVYADAAGVPGALLGQTSAHTVTAGASAAWVRLSLPAPVPLVAGTAYHLGIHSGQTTHVARYGNQLSTGAMRQNDDPFGDGATTSFGAVDAYPFELAVQGHYRTGPATPPLNTSVPTIGGRAEVGQVLTAAPGTWSGSPAPTYAYEWRSCDAAGANCSAIAGATGTSYTLAAGDAGRTVRVAVTATNSVGSASATSPATAAVQAAPARTSSVSGLANVWVDTNGGTCTRAATPGGYSDAAACASFQAAYQAAACGDTVLVKGGTYGGQSMARQASKDSCSARVVIAAAPNEAVTVAGSVTSGTFTVANTGAQHIHFRNIRVCCQEDPAIGWRFVGGSRNIVAENVTANAGPYLNDAHDITILGSEFGPCKFNQNSACNGKIENSSTNVVIDGANFHDMELNAKACMQAGQGGTVDCHGECLIVFAVDGLTVRNSAFHTCYIFGIFMQNLAPITNVLIENNWFDMPTNGLGVHTRTTAVSLSPRRGGFSNVLVRFNSFQGGAGIDWNGDANGATYTNVRAVGNLLGVRTCYPSVRYEYNVYDDGLTCSGTGEVALGAAFPYANGANGAGQDYRLTGNRSAIDDRVPVGAGIPAADKFGTARGANGTADAGSHER